MTSKLLAPGLAMLALILPAVQAHAQAISGKKDLVCASQNVTACAEGAGCMQGTAGHFELPVFMFVEFGKKRVRAIGEDGKEVDSPVKSHEVSEASIILQGFENDRGWTMAMDRVDSSFGLSVTGPELQFMISGTCTAL